MVAADDIDASLARDWTGHREPIPDWVNKAQAATSVVDVSYRLLDLMAVSDDELGRGVVRQIDDKIHGV